ncbi:MAG: dephospho-CoA kinase [Pseudomonadota bacterium]
MTTLIVGITGGIGSGKSAVTDRFAKLGIVVVDADIVARQVVEPGSEALTAIAEHFGNDVITPQGDLDRAELRKRVFSDESERLWLEQLTHPLIGLSITEQLRAAASPYSILSSPLLLETNQRDMVDTVVVVDVPETLQVERAARRDTNSEGQIRRIMAAQMPRQKRLELADTIIDNSGSLETLDAEVEKLHQQFLEQATKTA